MDPNLTTEELAKVIFQDFEMWAKNFAVFKGITGTIEFGLLPNKLQLQVIDHYRKCQIRGLPCLIMILKPRQKGASTIAEAVCYHHMRRYPNLNGSLMGDVQSTSDKVFEMFRRYAQEDKFPYSDGKPNILPGCDLADEITLGSGSKWWKETAGSTNAGRSGTVQVWHGDEVAYYPSSPSKDPTTAVLGSFYKEAPFSLGFATSTANGASGWFHDTWQGENDWFKIFAAWFEFPEAATPFKSESDKQHFIRTMKEDEVLEQKLYRVTYEQLHWRRKKIATDYKGDIGKFRQEYPSSADGAFLSSSRMRFDEVAIANMMVWADSNDARECGNLVLQGRRGIASWIPDPRGSVVRWEEPRHGCRYLISVDTCTGEDQQVGGTTSDPDWHSAQVWRQGYTTQSGDYLPPALVAMHHSREDTDILAEIVASMASYYGNCLVIPEVNNSGLHIVKCLVKHGCNVFRRSAHVQRRKQQTEEEKLEAFGWNTDQLTRKWIIDVMAPLIRQEGMMIYAREVLEQFKSFIVKDNGRCEAAPSKHDDHVLAACIAIYNLGAATEYKATGSAGLDHRRLQTDPRYMAPDGFKRRV
jgi:hypothetical protein